MSPQTRSSLTLAGLISGATMLVAALGMLANGVIELDKKLDARVPKSVADSLFMNDSMLVKRVARIEKHLGMRSGKFPPIKRPQEEVGLLRRVFRGLF